MKIGMTESKAMSGFFAGWQGEREEGVRFFRSTMALLGVEFDPEEPELPEKIQDRDLIYGPGNAPRRAEAVRRYNAWGKLRKWLESDFNGYTMKGNLLGILDCLLSEED